MKSSSISSYFVSATLRNLGESGLNCDQLLKKHNIPVQLVNNITARVSAEQFANLQQSITDLLQDETLGYVERAIPLGTFSMACHSLIHSKSLDTAMQRYCQFYELMERGLIPSLHVDGNYAYIRMQPSHANFCYDMYAYESALYYAHRLMNWLSHYHIPLQRVDLSYPAPSHAAEYRPLFFGAPVLFAQDNVQLVFEAGFLKKTVVQNQQSLASFLNNAIYQMLVQNYESTQWSTKVSELINKDLKHIPEQNYVANTLSIHPQTLRRRLHCEGTSFQNLKNESRRDFAIYKLSKTGESIEKIGSEIGFSEASTFIRAFRTWTGLTPSCYRKTD